MTYLKFFTIMLYSLAFANAGTDALASKEVFSFDLLIFAGVLTLPVFGFLLVRLIMDAKMMIDASSSMNVELERNEMNVIDLEEERQKRKKASTTDIEEEQKAA